MTIYHRLRARYEMDVDVSADTFFGALTTWESAGEWKSAPLPLARVNLFPGHSSGRVPCTRLCYPDLEKLPPGTSAEMLPEFISETLIQIDTETRFILYRIDGEAPMGMRNYVATTEVDDLGDGRARVICEGRGDLPADIPIDAIRALLETTYRLGVITGTLEVIAAKEQNAA